MYRDADLRNGPISRLTNRKVDRLYVNIRLTLSQPFREAEREIKPSRQSASLSGKVFCCNDNALRPGRLASSTKSDNGEQSL